MKKNYVIIRLKILGTLSLCLPYTLMANDSPFIPLEQILQSGYEYEEHEIHTRGFIYEWDEETSVLALQPALKSCCVGNKDKQSSQIILKSPAMGSSNRVVEVTGVLHRDHMNSVFSMDPVIVRDRNHGKLWIGIVGLLLICCLSVFIPKLK